MHKTLYWLREPNSYNPCWSITSRNVDKHGKHGTLCLLHEPNGYSPWLSITRNMQRIEHARDPHRHAILSSQQTCSACVPSPALLVDVLRCLPKSVDWPSDSLQRH